MTMYLQLHSDSFLVFVRIFFGRGREKLRRKYVTFFTVTFLCKTCSHAKFELLLWMRENFHGTVDFQ